MPPVPFPNVEDCVKSRWHFIHEAGVEANCVVNFRRVTRTGADITLAEMDSLRLAVDAVIAADVAALMAVNAWTLEIVTWQAIDRPLGPEQASTYNILGTRAGDSLPTQVACVVSHISDQPGRRGRGRNFWPFLSEDDTDDGFFLGASTAEVATFIDDIDNAAATATTPYSVAVVSHTYGTAGISAGFTVDTTPDIQRRRRPGR